MFRSTKTALLGLAAILSLTAASQAGNYGYGHATYKPASTYAPQHATYSPPKPYGYAPKHYAATYKPTVIIIKKPGNYYLKSHY